MIYLHLPSLSTFMAEKLQNYSSFNNAKMSQMATKDYSVHRGRGAKSGTGQDIFPRVPAIDHLEQYVGHSSNNSLGEQSDFPDEPLDMATFVNEEYLLGEESLHEEATMSHKIPTENPQTSILMLSDTTFPDLFDFDATGHDPSIRPWDYLNDLHGQTFCNPDTTESVSLSLPLVCPLLTVSI